MDLVCILSGAYDDSFFYLSVYVGLMIWKGEDAHMFTDGQIYMGLAEGQRVHMQLAMSNRHGLIAGASGTGRTITMKTMAESCANCFPWRTRGRIILWGACS